MCASGRLSHICSSQDLAQESNSGSLVITGFKFTSRQNHITVGSIAVSEKIQIPGLIL